MRRSLLPLLVCPDCLPAEQPLALDVILADGDEVLEAELHCAVCGSRHAVADGLAEILPKELRQAPAQNRYEEDAALSAYLWSHFADLWGDPDASNAYARLASCFSSSAGLFLDAGCAVGRMAFEAAARGATAVGFDLSKTFVRAARTLAKRGSIRFGLVVEGRLTEDRTIELPEKFRANPPEFLVADAQALPFRRKCFDESAALNLVDKLPSPIAHLRETARVLKPGGTFLFSDPFSWSEDAAPASAWLGGVKDGPFAGRGEHNVEALLAGMGGLVQPPFIIQDRFDFEWTIRHTARRFESIRPRAIKATR